MTRCGVQTRSLAGRPALTARPGTSKHRCQQAQMPASTSASQHLKVTQETPVPEDVTWRMGARAGEPVNLGLNVAMLTLFAPQHAAVASTLHPAAQPSRSRYRFNSGRDLG